MAISTIQPAGTSSSPGPYAAQSGIGDVIRHVLSLVRRDLVTIGAILFAALAAAGLLTMLQTPLYTARTAIQINDQGDEVLGNELDASAMGNAGWDTDRFLNTQIDILRSRGLALRVAEKLRLSKDAKFFQAMEVDQPGSDASRDARREQVVAMLRAGMVVDLPQSSRIATISFDSADPTCRHA